MLLSGDDGGLFFVGVSIEKGGLGHLTFSETLIPDSRSFFLANPLLFAVGQPFDTNDLAQSLSAQRLYLFRC